MAQDKRDAELAQCEGKAGFTSFALAKQVAERRSRHGMRGHPYRCPHCGQFHLGLLNSMSRNRRNWRNR